VSEHDIIGARAAFRGAARPLAPGDLDVAIDLLDAESADLWAVIGVETTGCGFQPDRRIKILFERHIFSRRTNGRFNASHPGISNPAPGGYATPGGGSQYDRLALAITLDEQAALESASWGIGQVMGFNAGTVGYPSANEMVAAMAESEGAQIEAMARFIVANHLDGALRSHDWARFARGYNGPGYRANNYDTRLAAEQERVKRGSGPDLIVRTAQIYLTFLGYDTFGVDGILGRLTRSALNDYQLDQGLEPTQAIDDAAIQRLAADVANLDTD